MKHRFRVMAVVLLMGVCACGPAVPPSATEEQAPILPSGVGLPETPPPVPPPVLKAETPFARVYRRARILWIPTKDTMSRSVVGALPDGRLIVRRFSRYLPYLDHVDILDPATGRSTLLQRKNRESYTVAAAAHGTRVVKVLGNDEPGGWILEVTDMRTGLTRQMLNTWGVPGGHCGTGWRYPVDLQFHRGELYFSRCVTGATGDVGVYRMGPGDRTPRLWLRGLYDIVWEGDTFLARSPVVADSSDPGEFTGSPPARHGLDGAGRGAPDPASYIARVGRNRDSLEYDDGTIAGLSPNARNIGISRHGRFAAWREGGAGWLLDARTRTAVRLPGRETDEVRISNARYLQWKTADGYHVLDLATLNSRG
ncbi:hypothetical protein [Streptosporangium sp. NPDC049046]|uniref:hypothetical protein n=1 Tax=Streptosporangium sp. NPDC049046 TaxID=3155031 RepID=UPI003419DE56